MNYIHNIATFLVNLKILDYFANFQVRAMKKLLEEGKVKHYVCMIFLHLILDVHIQ
jgi:hypothetical protein